MHITNQSIRLKSAFSLVEVLCLIVVIFLIAGLLGIYTVKARQKSKITQCLANLRQLGLGMALYEEANDGQLPFAYLKYNGDKYETWDHLIYPFIREESDLKGIASPEQFLMPQRLFRCPSDTIRIQHGMNKFHRRTYSMSWHSPTTENWPPGPENNTGVGLTWTELAKRGKPDSINNILHAEGHIPSVRLSMIPAPAGTLMLAEKARSANVLFHFFGAEIGKASECLDTKTLSADKYHNGKFNFLMVDGHVETLFPEQTLGKSGQEKSDAAKPIGNIWTIRADD